ncbi:MAG: RNA-directed DNA polymerase [Hominilimicola sp.]
MNDFDHMVKERLHIKAYGRYVDDFYLIHHDKEYLRYCLEVITNYLSKYGLELNEKTQIFPLKNGIDFLGFHTYLTESGKVIRKLKKSSKDNMRRKLKAFKRLYDEGKISMSVILCSYSSWRAHAKNGNTYYLIKRMDELFNELFKQGGNTHEFKCKRQGCTQEEKN